MDSSSSDEDNIPTSTSKIETEQETASSVCEEKQNSETNICNKESVDHLKDLSDNSNHPVGTNKPLEPDSSSNNVKFLSSEFFDQFICQPSTSKENPEIIRKVDVEKDPDLNGKLNSNIDSSESSEKNEVKGGAETSSSDCRLRKNIENSEEKRSNNKENICNPIDDNQAYLTFENFTPPFNFIQPEKKNYKSSEEYFSDLRIWLQQAFFWQSVTAAFPYFLMCQQLGQISNSPFNQQAPPGFNFPPQFQFPISSFQNPAQQVNQPVGSSTQSQQASTRQHITDG